MKPIEILAIQGSPRRNGNSDRLLDVFINEFKARMLCSEIEVMRSGMDIAPCLGCDKCISGSCIQKDSMQEIYGKFKTVDAIVLAAPAYFYGFPAHVKAMIDRCQLFYNLKYRRKLVWRKDQGYGALLACGASNGHALFDGMNSCAKYWYDALDLKFAGKVVVRGVDKPGEIWHHANAFEETKTLAAKIASALSFRTQTITSVNNGISSRKPEEKGGCKAWPKGIPGR